MSRLGRSYGWRSLYLHGRIGSVSAPVASPGIEFAAEIGGTTVTVPDAHVLSPGIEFAAEIGGTVIPLNAFPHSAGIEFAAEIGDTAVSVPVRPGDNLTAPGQLEYNGFVLARWVLLEGWRDTPPTQSGNVQQANTNGSYTGRPFSGDRVINLRFNMSARPGAAFAQLVTDFEDQCFVPTTADEFPIAVWDLGTQTFELAYGQLHDRRLPINPGYRQGLAKAAAMFVCGDPCRYSPNEHSVQLAKDEPLQILNSGNTESRRVRLRIPGPCENPRFTNETTGRTIGFNMAISGGTRLDVNVIQRAAGVGSVDAMENLVGSVGVADWTLPKGPSVITFTCTSGTSGAQLLWRDART